MLETKGGEINGLMEIVFLLLKNDTLNKIIAPVIHFTYHFVTGDKYISPVPE